MVNRVEAEVLCGKPVGNRAAAPDAVVKLSSPTRAAIITLGGEGLIVGDKSGVVTQIEPVPVQVTSIHGAGNCFIGVLSAGFAAGQSLFDACRETNARAAAFGSRQT